MTNGNYYRIENTETAQILGVYYAQSSLEAYNRMLEDANTPPSNEIPGDIRVEEYYLDEDYITTIEGMLRIQIDDSEDNENRLLELLLDIDPLLESDPTPFVDYDSLDSYGVQYRRM